jgi:CubicO group peptidase (beta-lactamase class C family)
MCTRSIVSSLTAITLFLISAGGLAGEPEDQRMQGFEKRLDGLRQELKIPAISAGIAKDGSLIWARGMGYADLEAKTRATPHTPYHLASLTKTFASTIVLQLVQEGRVSLEDPVSRYAIDLESDGVIRVKHIFSHTSEGVPGERYSYSGDRFGRLDNVIEGSTGRKFAELLTDSIFLRLDLEDTAPNIPPLPEVPPPADSERETVEAVRARLDTLMAAYNRLDVEKVKECFARDMTGVETAGPHGGRTPAPIQRCQGLSHRYRGSPDMHDGWSTVDTRPGSGDTWPMAHDLPLCKGGCDLEDRSCTPFSLFHGVHRRSSRTVPRCPCQDREAIQA